YACWRLREQSEGDGEEPNGEPGLFGDIPAPSERGSPATDYDRMAKTIRDWPADQLLDVRRPEIRTAIQRMARVPIEVYFVERFVQLAKPGGIIAVIVPESIMASEQLGPLRTWVMERVQLLAVVALPQKVFTGVGAKAKTGILFARRLTKAE